jgi:molybdopterin/thiamine biosynthesis adenylyltransferase
MNSRRRAPLTAEEKAVYEWQMWIGDLGESGQQALKSSSVLVSRCGGVGGNVAYHLAAAGVGRLIIAHGGNLKPGDLNRQLLMTHDWLGRPRIESIERRLRELNPRLDVLAVPENITDENVDHLARQADVIVDCAPLFPERYRLNRAAVTLGKPMVECAVYYFEAHVTTFVPGKTPCLACLYPEAPPHWKRQFPVLGAVAGVAGSLGATEAIKLLTGIGQPLAGRLLHCDLRTMRFHTVHIKRDPRCAVCGAR